MSKIEYRLSELNSQIDLLEESINQKVLDKVEENIKNINNILIESSSLEASLYLESELKKNLIVNYVATALRKVKYSIRKYSIVVKRNYSKYFKDEVNDLLVRLRLKNRKMKRWSASPLLLNEEKLNRLPFIYRKLFDGSVLESNDFLINDNDLNSRIEDALSSFNKSMNSATVLTGGPGSGKSTFINSIKK
nr:hypothetical protein [uncultured Sphaerochaeta sp.]